MKKSFTYGIILLCLLIVTGPAYTKTVNSQLAKSLENIFPEISRGYIDLNKNGTHDKTDELDETIPESIVNDATTQVKEILDFIIVNYRYIHIDKLKKTGTIFKNSTGEIEAIIALTYTDKIETIIAEKELLDSQGLYLTPREREEALIKISGFINTMIVSYKNEDKQSEQDFTRAKDEFFSMIEQGYPLPDYLNNEEKDILGAIMMHTISTTPTKQKDRINTAIKSLGRLKTEKGVTYILKYIKNKDFSIECIRALGNIGDVKAQSYLLGELDTTQNDTIKTEIIKALGKFKDQKIIDRLLAMLTNKSSQPSIPVTAAILNAIADIMAKTDARHDLMEVFKSHITSSEEKIRVAAVRGLAFFKGKPTIDLLLKSLTEETNPKVKVVIIKVLNNFSDKSIIIAFKSILISKSSTPSEKATVLNALGTNMFGNMALIDIVNSLNTEDLEISESASNALLNLYKSNAKDVINHLSGTIARATDKMLLINGTNVLSIISDPASLQYMIPLLGSPYSQVKQNVSWAMYRMKVNDARAVDELNKLVKSEAETLNVRINAIRALGAIRYDSPTLNIWQTLLNIAKMRGEKYAIMRTYAVKSLGELGNPHEDVITILIKLANKTADYNISLAAINALKSIALQNESIEKTLLDIYKKSTEPLVKITVAETLADLHFKELSDYVGELLTEDMLPDHKKRVIHSLSTIGTEHDIELIIGAARDKQIAEYIIGVAQDLNPVLLDRVIKKKKKTESDENIRDVINALEQVLIEKI